MKDKLIIAAALIILIAVVATCNKCWVGPASETKTDTVYVQVKDSTDWYRPEVTVIVGGQIPGKPQPVRVDSFIVYEKVPEYIVDTVLVLNDFYSKIYYSDTTKTKYGNIVVQDTVTQNRIAARRVLTDFKIPEITKTIIPKDKKWGIGFQGGYGLLNGKPSPYIGVGLHYSIIKF